MRKIIALLILCGALFSGCKTHQKFVSETTNHTSTEKVIDSLKSTKNEVCRDSVNRFDSIIVIYKDSSKYIERWHTEYKWKMQLHTDTIYKTKIIENKDTMYIKDVREVVKYKTPSYILWIIVVLVGLIILIFIFK